MFRARSALPMQCLCEFYSVTTRKRLLSQQRAQTIVEDCNQSLKIVAAEPAELAAAIDIHHRFGLQFFDSLLIATAYRAGCATLISEDMQDGQTMHGVELFNPFSRPSAALDRLLA
jgi:predicted nucleic acid-binding protein